VNEVQQMAVLITVLLTAVTAIGATASRLLRGLNGVIKAVGVDGEGKSASDRLEAQLTVISRRLERVEYQLHPNGGGSLVDKVNEVDRQLAAVSAQHQVALKLLTRLTK
jgi:hypothetical protein